MQLSPLKQIEVVVPRTPRTTWFQVLVVRTNLKMSAISNAFILELLAYTVEMIHNPALLINCGLFFSSFTYHVYSSQFGTVYQLMSFQKCKPISQFKEKMLRLKRKYCLSFLMENKLELTELIHVVYLYENGHTYKKTYRKLNIKQIPTYLPVSIMHICTGCLTGENLPNSTILSCNLCLLYRPSKSQVKEIPQNDVCPHCSWSPTPLSSMSWLPEMQPLWDPLVVHS